MSLLHDPAALFAIIVSGGVGMCVGYVIGIWRRP